MAVEAAFRVWLIHVADDETFVRFGSFAQLEARYGTDLQGMRDRRSLISHAYHRYLGYYPTPGYVRGANRHDDRGFRGESVAIPKPAGEYRIVCLGGSTTYGAAVEDFRHAYPFQLQEVLRAAGHERVTVVNAGAAGWSSWESTINLQFRVLDLDPDLILVLHGINDINARLVWPPERYRGDNSGRRRPNASGVFEHGALEHSSALRTLLVATGRIEPHASLARTVDPAPESYVGDDFLRQQLDGTYPSGIFATNDAASILRTNPPVYFRRNLEQIVATARAHEVDVALLTFNVMPGFSRAPRTNAPEYLRAYDEMNDVVRAVAESTGTVLVDLAMHMPRDRRLYADGHHQTPAGARVKAAIVARELARAGLP